MQSAKTDARGREVCVFQCLSRTDPIKPSLLFSNFVGSVYFLRIPLSDCYLHFC